MCCMHVFVFLFSSLLTTQSSSHKVLIFKHSTQVASRLSRIVAGRWDPVTSVSYDGIGTVSQPSRQPDTVALMHQAASSLRAVLKGFSKYSKMPSFKNPCLVLPGFIRYHFRAPFGFTCTNNLFNLDTSHVNLLGKLSDCFIGVLVREGVDVDLHSRWHFNREMGETATATHIKLKHASIQQLTLKISIWYFWWQYLLLTVTTGVMLDFVCVLWFWSVRISPTVDKNKEDCRSIGPPPFTVQIRPLMKTVWYGWSWLVDLEFCKWN